MQKHIQSGAEREAAKASFTLVRKSKCVPHPHHAADDVTGRGLVGLLQNALQQERVLGQSLVGLCQHVGELQAVALLMGLCPLNGVRPKQEVSQKRGERRAFWDRLYDERELTVT